MTPLIHASVFFYLCLLELEGDFEKQGWLVTGVLYRRLRFGLAIGWGSSWFFQFIESWVSHDNKPAG